MESVDVELAGLDWVRLLGVVLVASFQVLEHLLGGGRSSVESLASEVGVEEVAKRWDSLAFSRSVSSVSAWSAWESQRAPFDTESFGFWVFVITDRVCELTSLHVVSSNPSWMSEVYIQVNTHK